MLAWIKNRSDHPLADEKGAKEFLSELPTQDPYKTLEEITFWLDATRTSEGLKPLRIFEIIDLLDRAAKQHQRKLSQEYLAGGVRLQKFQEQRIWATVVEFWRQLGAAYEFCLAQTLPGVSGSGAIKPMAPTIAARALRALTLEVKWSLMRYGPVDPTLWGRLGALYAQAEASGFALKVCAAYPGAQGETTVQREYLKALMLTMSATDSLLPRKLEIAERIVSQYSDQFVMQRQPAKGCHCTVDLQAAKPPARVVAQVSPAPSLRYFGPGTAAEAVDQVIDTVAQTGLVPSSVNLGGTYEASFVVDVLGIWHATRRRSRRPASRNASTPSRASTSCTTSTTSSPSSPASPRTSTSSRTSRPGRWRTRARVAMEPSSPIRLPTGCRSAPCWASSSPTAMRGGWASSGG